jgi:hypothetical protein
MGFIERERDRIHLAICRLDPSDPACLELSAAKQALSWSMDPTAFASPFQSVKRAYKNLDIHQAEEDCPPSFDRAAS